MFSCVPRPFIRSLPGSSQCHMPLCPSPPVRFVRICNASLARSNVSFFTPAFSASANTSLAGFAPFARNPRRNSSASRSAGARSVSCWAVGEDRHAYPCLSRSMAEAAASLFSFW